MKFEITEEKLQEMFENDIKKHLKKSLTDCNLEYWVRKKVHEKLSDKIVTEIIEKYFSEIEIRKLLKEAIKIYVDERYE